MFYYDPVSESWERWGPKITNGGLDANLQDQHTEIIDGYLMEPTGSYSLVNNYNIDDNSIIVSGASAPNTGDEINIKEGLHFYQGQTLTVTATGDNWSVGLDSPLDYGFSSGAFACFGLINMAVDGSVTEKHYIITPSGLNSGVSWDITNVSFHILDQSAMDDSSFGGITALPNGVVLRVENTIYKNIFNVKKNEEFSLRNGELFYSDKAPAGFYGVRSHRHFGGQGNNGVTIRLDAATNDRLVIIIQDDLSELDEFFCVAQGHVVE